MADIVTSRIFTDGERGITAQKLNDIVGSSVIQPAFYTSKPTAGTADPTDIALILKAGAYAQVPVSTLAGSTTQAQIWSTRLRSFNAIGNPNFEVNQRTVAGSGLTGATTGLALDRWFKGGALSYQVTQVGTATGNVPGTSFAITQNVLRFTLTTQKTSLAASDSMYVMQYVEGPALRELINDVHSISLMVRSTVASVAFGVLLRDSAGAYSLANLGVTSATPNTWSVVTFPNLPIWTSSATFPLTPGSNGYLLSICLAAGSTYVSPANSTWQAGNFLGAAGQSNFAANPVNSTFDIAFVQHEPGSVCSTFMDSPFQANLDSCLRYYQKSSGYAGAALQAANAVAGMAVLGTTSVRSTIQFKKIMAKVPTIRTCGNVPATNQVFQDALGTNNTVASYTANDSAIYAMTMNAAFPATGAVSVLCGWDADTGW